MAKEFKYTSISNLFWGNATLLKPTTVPSIVNWTTYRDLIEVDWVEPYQGAVTLIDVEGINYCYYEDKFYFVEPIKWYEGGKVQYRILYDFWINEILRKNFEIKGLLTKTNNRQLVLENINHTVPVIESGNKLNFINVEHEESSYRPRINFRLVQTVPWISYYSPEALRGAFLDILRTSSNKAKSSGIEEENLKLPAVLYTNKHFVWWSYLLNGLANFLFVNLDKLKVYEVKRVDQGFNFEQALSNFRDKENLPLKRLGGTKFILLGDDHADYTANTILSTYKIRDLDFSGLKNVYYLGKDLTYQNLPKKKLSEINYPPLLQVPPITKEKIRNYYLSIGDLQQVLKVGDQEKLLTTFKIGEIKDYSRLTHDGQVLQDGNLEILVGLKNLDQVVNWDVEVTQAAFLNKHGIYKSYPVKKGEIIIPLSKYYLSRERPQERASQLDPRIYEHHETYFDFLNVNSIQQTIAEANRKDFFGDQWFEKEALVVMPIYKENSRDSYYTYGYLTTDRLNIEGVYQLVGQSRIYLTKIQPIQGNYTNIQINQKLFEAPSVTKPKEVQYWEDFFNLLERARVNSTPGIKGNFIYISIPKNLRFPQMEEWVKGNFSELMNIELADSNTYETYKVPIPCKYLLSKFLRDWENPTKTEKWVNYAVKQIRGEKAGSLLIRYFKNHPYFLFVPENINVTTNQANYFRMIIEKARYRIDSSTNIRVSAAIWDPKQWFRDYSFEKTYRNNNKSTPYLDFYGKSFYWNWTVENIISALYLFNYHQVSDLFKTGYIFWRRAEDDKKYYYWEIPVSAPNASILPDYKKVLIADDFPFEAYKKRYGNEGGDRFGELGPLNKDTYRDYLRAEVEKWTDRKIRNDIDNFFTGMSWPTTLHWYTKQGGEHSINPTSIDLTKFDFADLSKKSIPSSVDWFDFATVEVNQHYYFDLAGTNYLLAFKITPEQQLNYRIILKDPSKTLEPYKFLSYKISTPVVIDNLIQIVNQFNTLHFFGEQIPLKVRMPISNEVKFPRFTVTPLEFEGQDSPYEYRHVEIETSVDVISKVVSTLKESKSIVGLDQFKYEELKYNHEMARNLRALDRKELRNQKEEFYLSHQIKKDDWHYKYKGQGYEDWLAQRDFNRRAEYLAMGSSTAMMGVGTIAAAVANPVAGLIAGTISAIFAGANVRKVLSNPVWEIEERQRDWNKRMELRRMRLEEDFKSRGFLLAGERLAFRDLAEEHKERLQILASTNNIELIDINDRHIHKALSKELQVSDVYMSVNYPQGWLLDKLAAYYERYGYDLELNNFTLNNNNLLSTGANIKFEIIESINIEDKLVRNTIEAMFTSGIRLKELS